MKKKIPILKSKSTYLLTYSIIIFIIFMLKFTNTIDILQNTPLLIQGILVMSMIFTSAIGVLYLEIEGKL